MNILPEDGTKGSNFTADESIISKSADMTQSGKSYSFPRILK
jgi:hypothetical protein